MSTIISSDPNQSGRLSFYRVFTEFYRVLPGLNRFYRVLPGFTGFEFFQASLGFRVFYLILLDIIVFITGFE